MKQIKLTPIKKSSESSDLDKKLISLLVDLQVYSFKKKNPFIIYRLPKEDINSQLTILFSCQKMVYKKTSLLREITSNHPAFSFHPFQDKKGSFKNKSLGYYSIDIIYYPSSGILFFNPLFQSTAWELKSIILQNIKNISNHTSSCLPMQLINQIGNSKIATTSKSSFKQNVELATSIINQKLNPLEKVVLSKIKLVKKHFTSFKLIKCFLITLENNPNALVSLVVDEKIGCWMGASPEILVKKTRNNIFSTVSLAGTKIFSSKESLDSLTWTQKEIEEQADVSRYIVECFKKIRLREYIESGPYTVVAGNLAHLRSDFSTDLNMYYGETLPLDMLQLLHPTSAVGGTPKNQALKLIQKLEDHDRKFYAGFLGPVGIDNEINIYVNLRCVEISIDNFCLYSGSGITGKSNAEKEWQETEDKLKVMEQVLK